MASLTQWTWVRASSRISWRTGKPCVPQSMGFMGSQRVSENIENKVYHGFHCFPIYYPWSDGTRCHDLSFLNVEVVREVVREVYNWLRRHPFLFLALSKKASSFSSLRVILLFCRFFGRYVLYTRKFAFITFCYNF